MKFIFKILLSLLCGIIVAAAVQATKAEFSIIALLFIVLNNQEEK